MSTLRQAKGRIPLVIAALVIIALAFFGLGRVTSQLGNAPAPSPTATRIVPTPTPRLALSSSQIIASFAYPTYYDTCIAQSCFSVKFQASGPFDVVVTASTFDVNPDAFGVPGSYTLSLYNGAGHLVDQVTQGPFDPSQDKASTDVIPEVVAAGSYQIQVTTGPYSFNVDVVVLSASQ